MSFNETAVKSDIRRETKRRGECVIISNPCAGSGRCEVLLEAALKRFDEEGLRYRVIKTERPYHATELALAALEGGAETLIVAGGDGTLREVASALAGKEGVEVCILPFGTGNDFASALNIPTDPREAAELALYGEAKKCDLARANSTVYTNVCGLGFDVEVLKRVEKHKKGRKGMLPYALGIIDALFNRKKIRARISIDGGETLELDTLLITLCNGRRFGGGMLVAPDASAGDGLIDVMIVKWIGFFKMIVLLPLFLKGGHIGKKPVIHCRARSIRVETQDENTVETDGELIERTPLLCEILPASINVVRP